MSEEYDEDSMDDDGVVAPVAPSPKKIIADGNLRTFNRKLVGYASVALLILAVCYLAIIQQTRDSVASAAASESTPLPVSLGLNNQQLLLPASTPVPTDTPRPLPISPPLVHIPHPDLAEQSSGGGAQAAPIEPRTPSPEELFAEQERQRVLDARRAPTRIAMDSSSVEQGGNSGQTLAQGSAIHQEPTSDAVSQAPHQQFLAQHSGELGYLPVTSAYEVTRGTVIHARWLTTLDSTLPGGVLKAMVTETVYDSKTHAVPVIPAGSILTGEGDSQTKAGEARYLCVFDRLEFPAPDSRKFSMGANTAVGEQGENGATVSTDTHAGRDFGHAMLYAMLQSGVNLASRASTVVDVGGNISQGIPQTNAHSNPTYHQYVGEPLTIIVAQDLPLDRFRSSEENQ